MPDAIHVVDSDLNILLINKTFKRWIKILGLDSDVVGKNITEAFPFLKYKVIQEYQHVFEKAESITTLEKNRVRSRTITTQTKKIPVLEDGRVVQAVTIIKDVTEPRRIREELIKSESEKNIILNNLSELVVYHDLSGKMLWVNKAAAESVGKKQDELVGKQCYKIWHNRDSYCVGCPVVRAKETGLSQESEITSPDGRVWLIRGCPVKD